MNLLILFTGNNKFAGPNENREHRINKKLFIDLFSDLKIEIINNKKEFMRQA